ncbi:hypothetical protein, partial [Mesorhizobium sp.]|uniref:hypothetical protein n=1 Tax=Mesorhizobium sp. TaxID=1871066 RepID=UPI0025D4B306
IEFRYEERGPRSAGSCHALGQREPLWTVLHNVDRAVSAAHINSAALTVKENIVSIAAALEARRDRTCRYVQKGKLCWAAEHNCKSSSRAVER